VKPFRIAVAAAAAGALLLAGCAGTTPDTGSTGSGAVLKVGMIDPLTGSVAWAGVPISQGAQTAVKEINASGILGGSTIQLTVTDSEGDPAKAISQFKGFDSDGSIAVICCSISSEAGSFAQLAAQAKLPTVVNGATLAGLAQPPYIYRPLVLPADPGGMYSQVAESVVKNAHVKTAVVVETADNEGNVADAKQWISDLTAHGVNVLQTVDTFQNDTDFTVPVTNIASLDPDLVVFSTQGPKSATMIKGLRDRGFKGLTASSYGVAVPSVWDVGGSSLAGTIFPLPFSPLGDSDTTKTFVKDYKADWGAAPDLYAAQGYNAMWLIAKGLEAAGAGADREALAQALAGLKQFQLASGNVVDMVDGQAKLADQVIIAQWNADGTQSLWP